MNAIIFFPKFIIPSVTSISWNPNLKVLPLCVELNNHTIDQSLIHTAIDNVNKYLYTGNIDTTSLFLYDYNYTNFKCPDSDLKIKIIKSKSTSDSPGYCSRKYINGTISSPQVLYIGCDITLNVCALQSNSIFYNVLLHELLHILGLDHPPEKDNSVMSYHIIAKDSSLNFIKQTDEYISIQPKDISDIRFIISRDFPNSYLPSPQTIQQKNPNSNPGEHVSGTNLYQINDYASRSKCWEPIFVSFSPTFIQSPTQSPTKVKPKKRKNKNKNLNCNCQCSPITTEDKEDEKDEEDIKVYIEKIILYHQLSNILFFLSILLFQNPIH
jgi:hypothetical protein